MQHDNPTIPSTFEREYFVKFFNIDLSFNAMSVFILLPSLSHLKNKRASTSYLQWPNDRKADAQISLPGGKETTASYFFRIIAQGNSIYNIFLKLFLFICFQQSFNSRLTFFIWYNILVKSLNIQKTYFYNMKKIYSNNISKNINTFYWLVMNYLYLLHL